MSVKRPDDWYKTNLIGVDSAAQVVQNESGGLQSKSIGDYTLLPPLAIQAVAANLEYGARKYEPWNWLLIPTRDHVNHTVQHILAYTAGDVTNDHLEPLYDGNIAHLVAAATRALFALDVALRGYHDDIEVDI